MLGGGDVAVVVILYSPVVLTLSAVRGVLKSFTSFSHNFIYVNKSVFAVIQASVAVQKNNCFHKNASDETLSPQFIADSAIRRSIQYATAWANRDRKAFKLGKAGWGWVSLRGQKQQAGGVMHSSWEA